MKIENSSESGFTLIEMLTVMAVIGILASLIVGVNSFVQRKAARVRAEGEIKTMGAACENYKADAGDYPRDVDGGISTTDELDPRIDGDPSIDKYRKASLLLYKELSGDKDADGKSKDKPYCEYRPDQLQKNSSGEIKFIKDPFGNSYGYSTAGKALEEKYREALLRDPSTSRPSGSDLKGFSPNFDLWSTGGVISKSGTTGSVTSLNSERKRWVKNW